MISIMHFILKSGAIYWMTIAPVQCEAIRAHIARGGGSEVLIEINGKPEPIKAAHCAKVRDWGELYGVQMQWLREDGEK